MTHEARLLGHIPHPVDGGGQPDTSAPTISSFTSAAQHFDLEAREERKRLGTQFRNLGTTCFKAGSIIEAHANFRFALNCTPDDAELHALIANTALRLSAPHLAAYHAETALAVDPNNLDALVALAGARLRLKSPKARETIDDMARFEQLGDFRTLLRIALNSGDGDYESAIVDLATYLEGHPRDVLAGELLADTFLTFQASGQEERFSEFLEGVGVVADPAGRAALSPKGPVSGPCVDIIIPVYNGIDDLVLCLASIRRWPSEAIRRIILVDDCSAGETAGWLTSYRDEHSDVQLVRNVENLGFTRAVMAGVRQSTAPYMLLLNSDTQVTPHWLEGMLKAMHASPHTALVGPLSNNAYYQTIDPNVAAGAPPQDKRAPADVAALVRCTTGEVFPRVPFLSGFCLLVDRTAFDLVGGLDCVAFPHGYWEVQDLCLKLTDVGRDAVVADNVYVHHKGGGSINGTRRKDLIMTGLVRLYDRYSGMRVLIAEALCASQPEITRQKMAWAAQMQINRHPGIDARDNREGQGKEARQHCRKLLPTSVSDREVCLFVLHCPLGAPSEYSFAYLEEVKRNGLLIIVCLVVEDLSIPVSDQLMQIADGVLLRENAGYDFGAWADTLRHFPQLWSADRLYFVNDSILGPFGPLTPILECIRAEDAGFFALCECTYMKHHAQSFFFGWNKANLASKELRLFWNEVENLSNKDDVIRTYELEIASISQHLPKAGKQIVFGYEKLFGCNASEITGVSPTHHAWRRLLVSGFPFVKTSLLREGITNVDTTGWQATCEDLGANLDAIYRSIETSHVNRLMSSL